VIIMNRLYSFAILLIGLLVIAAEANAQQLRDVVRQVDSSVVVIKTVEKNLLLAPHSMFVSSPGSGSGVLISSDGQILTAAHVVQAADKIEVEFSDGQLVPAKVIASVPSADLAMIKLDWVPYNAKPARLGDSDKMQIGDDVFVIGAPYGMGHSLSAGHVSARRVPKNGNALALEMLQTDAAINKGNSGGPMFNFAGEVVGIVSQILSHSGGSEGMGFAVTSNLAHKLLIVKKGFWSGIDGLLLAGEWVRIFNIPQPAGLLVQRIADNSPGAAIGLIGGTYKASIAGGEILVGGDIILSVGEISVTPDGAGLMKVWDHLNSLKPGDPVAVKVLRAGQVVELKAQVPSR
jgi:S1-C subfamily serine protease